MSGKTEFSTVAKIDVTHLNPSELGKEECKREIVPPTRESFLGLANPIHRSFREECFSPSEKNEPIAN